MNALDDLGRTPLNISVCEGASVVAATLLAHGAKMNVHDILNSCEEEWVRIYVDWQSSYKQFTHVAASYIPEKLVERSLALRLYHQYRSKGCGASVFSETSPKLKGMSRSAALCGGFSSIFLSMLEDESDINSLVDGSSLTALHMAVQAKHHSMISSLLRHRADANVKHGKGLTPFQLAIKMQDVAAIEIFLDHGVSVNEKCPECTTALHQTARDEYCKASVLELLIQRNANVHATDNDGNTPLHLAARANGLTAVEKLVEAGSNVDARNNYGRTPLAEACRYPPVNYSSIKKSQGVVSLILDAGADMHNQDHEGLTPFHHVVRAREYSAGRVKIFIERGADIHARDLQGRTALHHALANYHTDYETVTLLLKQGADVHTAADNGDLPIHLAVRWEVGVEEYQLADYDTECGINIFRNGQPCQLLLEHGADPNARDRTGLVGLHMGSPILTWKALILSGARVDERDPDGRTTLLRLFARPFNGKEDSRAFLAGVLLFHGADANARDDRGYTALMYAVGIPRPYEPQPASDCIRILMHYGADPNLENSAGFSALRLCQDGAVKKMLDKFYKERPALDNGFFGFS